MDVVVVALIFLKLKMYHFLSSRKRDLNNSLHITVREFESNIDDGSSEKKNDREDPNGTKNET